MGETAYQLFVLVKWMVQEPPIQRSISLSKESVTYWPASERSLSEEPVTGGSSDETKTGREYDGSDKRDEQGRNQIE